MTVATYQRKPGRYGSKEACFGSWHAPAKNTMHIHPETHAYYQRERQKGKHVPRWAGFRAQCAVCGKDCSIRTDGTVGAHVNTKLSRQRKRDEVKTAIATAKTDLLALRNELLSEEDA